MADVKSLNQGVVDTMLMSPDKSFFTNMGYVRHSNFSDKYVDVDPQTSACNLGSTVQYVIPHAGDLLGQTDLIIEFDKASVEKIHSNNTDFGIVGWVEALGYAMIDTVRLTINNELIEELTGDQLYIQNELMREPRKKYGHDLLLRSGRPLHTATMANSGTFDYTPTYDTEDSEPNRIIVAQGPNNSGGEAYQGKHLIIPLDFDFTKHPSKYLPIAAIETEIRIAVRLRSFKELCMVVTAPTGETGGQIDLDGTVRALTTMVPDVVMKTNFMRCKFVDVEGTEASAIRSQSHTRLQERWYNQYEIKTFSFTSPATEYTWDIKLDFLHPTKELLLIFRKASEMSTSTDPTAFANLADQGARTKNYFAFQGGGYDPNIESYVNMFKPVARTELLSWMNLETMRLTLNGQDIFSSLNSTGMDIKYMKHRMTPQVHTNTDTTWDHLNKTATKTGTASHDDTLHALHQKLGSKEIYALSFALNPEISNPTGSANFGKVANAMLKLKFKAYASTTSSIDIRADIFAVCHNFVTIENGRAQIAWN